MQDRNGELEDLYSKCRQQLFTCALVITGSPARAEDAIHEAFCRVISSETEPQNLKAYVFKSVRNASLDQMRRLAAEPVAYPEMIFDVRPNPAHAAEEADFQQSIVELMKHLNTDEQETIVQHLYGELSFQEIATIRGAPIGTIASWYRRGMEKLRRSLEVIHGPV
ncbi:RNA polymerase sigma factor [Bythopirellula polymerisocia]|uniref:ECF RNA polymerase sigma factor SigR n=1 Tax=Bythopirellula polymerisocia TaxID=2528003 RepID=A0A5C6D0L9_9BACT|nr:sigma-70 family RNA polymerase sigma factor [Bythopirellula polymerisocia]TWU29374.1 ECF RNA polymerase sigma factor SigR [Bythopirellula polymerisocia]